MSFLKPMVVKDQKTVTLTAASTAATVVPEPAPQYELNNTGAVDAWIRWHKTAASVATIPSGSTGGSYYLGAGQCKVITVDDPAGTYTFSGITAAGTSVIAITPGGGE